MVPHGRLFRASSTRRHGQPARRRQRRSTASSRRKPSRRGIDSRDPRQSALRGPQSVPTSNAHLSRGRYFRWATRGCRVWAVGEIRGRGYVDPASCAAGALLPLTGPQDKPHELRRSQCDPRDYQPGVTAPAARRLAGTCPPRETTALDDIRTRPSHRKRPPLELWPATWPAERSDQRSKLPHATQASPPKGGAAGLFRVFPGSLYA